MTSPALAIDPGEHIGRLYRRPGQPLPERATVDEDGKVTIRRRAAEAEILAGNLVPSITNVVGVRNAPHLNKWYARKAAQEAVKVARDHPGLMTERPHAAVDYLKTAADRDRDAAAAQGDAVHNACEDIARGLPCPPLPREQMLYVDSFKGFCDRFQPEFLHLECTVFGRTPDGLGYGGTGDFIAKINGLVTAGDYKTNRAGIHALDVGYQLAGIANAEEMSPDNETLVPMIDIDAAVVVHLNADGYQCAPAVIDGEAWEGFCNLRRLWDSHVLDGMHRDGRKAVGRVLSGPEALTESMSRREQSGADLSLAG